ncbi:MAG: hypothetical protein A2068_12050 [Ignavibacteria bacterium GWB2_35_6b]|nr:MAG: hypothetical protein A2068_12050 [Ignavibacteria bacterium GWB2_35_6b]
MKYIILILVIFCGILAQDSSETNSVFPHNNENVINRDNSYKIIIADEISFWEKYQSLIGALVGSLFAALIAIWSIYRTHNNQINIENEKIRISRSHAENVYHGFIFSVHTILINHEHFLNSLTEELRNILANAKKTGKLAYDRPYTYLAVDLLKNNLNKILAYESYDAKNVQLLVTYLNHVENLYNDLNFIPLIKLRDDTKKEDEYLNRLEYYFDNLVERVNILKEMVKELLDGFMREAEISEKEKKFI